ncbi:hypothetical protein ScalyP_jg11482 [Parmales sp. scaly parma]|nr:hypothetical protein ScalyP_jg11482 [Parmales sp. scaly parma]
MSAFRSNVRSFVSTRSSLGESENEISYPTNYYQTDCVSNAPPLSYTVTSLDFPSGGGSGDGTTHPPGGGGGGDGDANANYLAIGEARRNEEEQARLEARKESFLQLTKARLKEQRRSGKIKSKADLAREREESKMRAYEKKQATVRVRSVLVKGGSPDSRKISKATESIATATATATTTTTTTIKIPTSSVPINRAAGAPAVPFIGSPNPKNARAALLRHKK